jgi:phosphopantothenoylcysteine decarboxylase/phosphopantothenate--cysteine ligase
MEMKDYHPSFDIIGSKGSLLKQKRIVLCITGSVAAVRAPEIARELMRQGAHVFPVMTESACRIIHPDSMHWATGHKPVEKLSGAIEHIALAGNAETRADLVLVAPATANTISKIACAIDDTAVTSVVTTALGQGIPLLIAPAMHESMYNHPLLKENMEKLKEIGVDFCLPQLEEGKAKILDTETVVRMVFDRLSQKKSLRKKKVLITSGRTVEYIDPVRVITNNSSGKMGRALVQSALAKGARVTVISGKAAVSYPAAARIIAVETAEQMRKVVSEELSAMHYDLCIAAAAVGDWKPKKTALKKISTHMQNTVTLELEATPKIVDSIKKLSPATFVVAFRAVHNLKKQELIDDALTRLKKAQADLIVVNDVSRQGAGFEADTNEVSVISRDKRTIHLQKQSKEQIAEQLLEIIAEKMRKART